MQFSPFHDNLLATSSSDGTVKVWVIPEGGEVKENITAADSDLKGHSKKVMLC
jgi:WD40 repeat protein